MVEAIGPSKQEATHHALESTGLAMDVGRLERVALIVAAMQLHGVGNLQMEVSLFSPDRASHNAIERMKRGDHMWVRIWNETGSLDEFERIDRAVQNYEASLLAELNQRRISANSSEYQRQFIHGRNIAITKLTRKIGDDLPNDFRVYDEDYIIMKRKNRSARRMR